MSDDSLSNYGALSIHGLHALAYCERLYYLENVEKVRLADAAVYAGRRLHVEIEREEEGEWHSLDLESPELGLRGRVDCLRRRDGLLIPYEHKRGRAARERSNARDKEKSASNPKTAWPSDRIQAIAYAMLIEDVTGETVSEARVRYHQDNVTVRIPVDANGRMDVRQAIERARELSASVERPPVTTNERLCVKCSLAPACLPEESRRAGELDPEVEARRAGELDSEAWPIDSTEIEDEAVPTTTIPDGDIADGLADAIIECSQSGQQEALFPALSGNRATASLKPVVRLFPADDRRQSLHIVTPGARVGRAGDQIEVVAPDEPARRHPVREIGQVVLHGFSQITTQALRLCADKDVAVHWVTQGGAYVGSFSAGAGSVQRRIRQYRALTHTDFCLSLSRRLAEARITSQLRFLLRASRGADRSSTGIAVPIERIRGLYPALKRAASIDEIRGVEGRAGAHYFEALPSLIDESVEQSMRPEGRSRRPPRDRFNALIGFGYALLLKDVMSAILVVGLDPALGFYHRPRSQAHPLALDLIELFRVTMVDLAVVASINRRQWDVSEDFSVTGRQVWLSELGRRKLIEIYERRKADVWKHPMLGYSLSYGRLIELETRLLEKEWTGEPGLFARLRLR